MAFQFQCPQGHLLEGSESQAGQQCVCPMCGMLFIIPAPLAAPAATPGAFQFGGAPALGNQPSPADPQNFLQAQPQSQTQPQPAAAPTPAEPELLHIPCPNGHELETPVDMLDQEVLCPECEAQFVLRRKDSIEFKKQKEEDDRRREARLNQMAFKWSIIAAVVVGIGLIVLIVMANMN